MNTEINDRLRKSLKGENLSHLTRKLGLPRGFLHRIIKEGRSPSLSNIDALVKIADYIGISLELLLTGRDQGKIVSHIEFEDENRKYKIKIERVK